MREIEFRMFSGKPANIMIYDFNQVFECLKQQLAFDKKIENAIQYNHRQHGAEFLQYTGFKDIAGNKIFEGDFFRDSSVVGNIYENKDLLR